MYKKIKNLLLGIILTLLLMVCSMCSVMLISKSDNVKVNQSLDETLEAEVDLFSKDSIGKKRKKQ